MVTNPYQAPDEAYNHQAQSPYVDNPPPEATNPYGSPYPATQPYPAMNPYQPFMATANHPQGTAILVLGILGLVVMPILGPVAWIMGNGAVADIDAGRYTDNGARVGRILGIIATCVYGAIFLLMLLVSFLVIPLSR